jgi:hypothetical protein
VTQGGIIAGRVPPSVLTVSALTRVLLLLLASSPQRIYVTLFPCNECAKLLIQAGIQEVVFNEVGGGGEVGGGLAPGATHSHRAPRQYAAALDIHPHVPPRPTPDPQAKLEPTGRRPGTMEQAAAADCQEDEQQQQQRGAAGASGSSDHAPPKHEQQVGRQQRTASGASSSSSSRGGGATKGGGVLDDSYAASQRLLTLAGVNVRQHTLRHTVCLGPK